MEADTVLAGPGAAVVFPAALAHPPSDPCCRSQDPERSAHSDRAASAHQRQPRAQDLVAERVRQDHSGDGGSVRQGTAALHHPAARPAAAPPIRHGHSACPACGRANTFTAAASTARGGGDACKRLRLCSCVQIIYLTYYDSTYYARSWRARKRCCTCSSGRASTSRRRSRRPRRRLRFRTFLAGSLWRC
eukprot:scaffold54562_cov65-Phaeocystis_antarctica.AAC.1